MHDLSSARNRLQGLIDDASVARGYHYAREGRGVITGEQRESSAVLIEARCQGSRPKPYEQQVRLTFDEAGTLDLVEGDCTCPMEADCKHVACVALLWLSRNGGDRAAERRAQPAKAPAGPRAVMLPPQAEEWLREFERAVKRPRGERPAKGECLVYVLAESPPVLRALKARALKDGRLVELKPVPSDLQSYRNGRELPRYVGTLDLPVCECLQQLRVSHDWDGWELAGALGAKALEASLATGRLRLDDGRELYAYGARRTEICLDGAGWLKRGADVQASLHLATDRSGQIRWTARSGERADAGVEPIAVSPPWYVDRGRGELGRLELPGDAAAVAQLLRMPAVDRERAPFLLSTIRDIAVEAGLTNVVEQIPQQTPLERPALQARLRLTRGRFRSYRRSAREEARWIAELWFDYGAGLALPADSHATPGIAWRDAAGNDRIALRDLPAEAGARQRLGAAGLHLRPARSFGSGVYRTDAERDYFCPLDGSERAWRAALNDVVRAAAAAGAQLDVPQDFPVALHEADDLYADFGAAEARGWFDLELGIVVDGKRVSLAGALAEWIRRKSDFARWLSDEHGEAALILDVAPLGLVRFSAERLKRLLQPLVDTFALERAAENGKLRLSRIEAALLPDVPGAASAAAAQLARLRERLADFRGIRSTPPAPGFRGALRAYQQTGLDWLQFLREYELAGILADDMGLGKTVQALAHLHLEKAAGRAGRPSIVIAPTSVLPNWREEAARFAPDLKVLVLHGARRVAEHARIGEADLVLTTYPLLARDRAALERFEYHLAIFDEAQFLKNAATQAHAAAAALKARHCIALTGTPIENNLAELWAHFNLLMPGFLGDARQFARAWRSPIEKEGDRDRMARLARRVRPFILRRTRAEVLAELPEKTEIVQHVELEGAQRDLYESLRMALDGKLRRAIAAKGIAGTQIEILDALMKLRQACCDPRLVKSPAAAAARGSSAKLEALREMLAGLRAEGKRTLLFSQFTSMLDLIEAELPALRVRHVRLTGRTRDREAPVRAFQAGDADVFLISLRAGGTGLNLTAADTVIHYDPWWNPAVEAQATARAHRIGQDKAVFAYKLIALGTVEERILELVKRKQLLADALLGEGRASGPLITEEDLATLLAPAGAAGG